MKAILLACLILLFAGRPAPVISAEGLSQGAAGLIVNGGFEKTLGLDQRLEGWEAKGAARGVKPGARGERALILEGTRRHPEVTVKQKIAIPGPLPLVATVSLLVKASGVESPSDDHRGTAEVRVVFTDDQGAVIGGPRKLDEWSGSFDWKAWSRVVRVPAGAVHLELALGLNEATGKVFFDEVDVLWGFPADRDLRNLLADGGFEYVNPLSEWKLGKSHRVVFPGFVSRAALEIRHDRFDRSESRQDIVLNESHAGKRLHLAFRLKLDQVVARKKRGGLRIECVWFGEEGRPLKEKRVLGPWKGNFDWIQIREEFSVPKKARRLAFKVSMEKAKGTARMDEIRLEAADLEDSLVKVAESKTDTAAWKPFLAAEGPLADTFDASTYLDPPAGRHGFLGVKDGHFVFEDGTPIRFLGVNLTAEHAFPSHEEAGLLAERLAQYGFNLIRLHHLDTPWAERNIFDPAYDDTQHLSEENLDRLDYFIARLKARGIYVYMDLLVSRLFKKGDGVPAYRRLEKGAKIAAQYHPRLIELQKKYARALLTHENPYTRTRYVEEPALALVDLINESSLFKLSERRGTLPQIYLDELERLRREYEKQNPEADLQEFYADLQLRYFTEFSGFLRGLGLRIPVAGSNLALDGPDLATNASLDFIDRHAYWDHPKGGFGDLVKFNNDSVIEVVQQHNLLAKLSRMRVAGKPFVVSEWNIAWPNEFRAAGPGVMAAYALFQDWDGLILFNYEGRLKPTHIQGNFDASTKPELFLQFPAVSRMFHRRDVAPAQKRVSYGISSDGVKIPASMGLLHGMERTEGEAKKALRPEVWGNSWKSDTGELYWDKKNGRVAIDTSRTQAVMGRVGGELVTLSSVDFSVKTPFASLLLISLDGENLEDSKRLVLITAARSENTGTVYNATRTVLRTSGVTPILMEPVIGRAALAMGQRGEARVFALDAAGRRIQEVMAVSKGNSLEIPLGHAHAYEILFGEKP